ncbi:hypothetical protein BS17DRAFT_784214 [Gyrodon lividus]|nr:hypothetical protein BS17DRAFT_784214 [Gyrodon lividus]
MASVSSLPAPGLEERFDKAKKHLWASDKYEEHEADRFAQRREPSMESLSPDYIGRHSGQPGATDRPRSPQWKARPETPECILKAPLNRPQHVLPPLSREGFNFDHDSRLPPPRSWSTTEHSHLRDRPISRSRTASFSLAEPRTNNESRQQRPSYPVSLSVFNSPTATYMWPGFQAASQMSHPPVIYVNYDSRDSTRSASTSSVSSLHDSPVISSPALRHYDRSATNMLPQKRRSTSPDGPISPVRACSFRNIIGPMTQVQLSDQDQRPQSAQRSQQQGGLPHPPLTRPFTTALARTPSTNNSVTSSDEDQLRTSREGSQQASETGERCAVIQPAIRRPSPRGDAEAWERYARPTLSPDGTTRKWLCTWPTPEDGKSICAYNSKKQLVKRHIETTHLRYKPFICEVCKKGFPQKTSLDTHMHGHTGSTPHVCRYGCGMAFKDPARRHRHMVEEHGYVPRQSKKKHRTGQSHQETSSIEPVRPFTFISGSDQ